MQNIDIHSQIENILKIVQKSDKLVAIPPHNFLLYSLTTVILFIGIRSIFEAQLGFVALLLFLVLTMGASALLSNFLFRNEFKKQERDFKYTEYMVLVNTLAFFLTLFSLLMSLVSYVLNIEFLLYMVWLFNFGVHSFIFGFFTRPFLKYYGVVLVMSALFLSGFTLFEIFNHQFLTQISYYTSLLLVPCTLLIFALTQRKSN
jgi:hypothetical protein